MSRLALAAMLALTLLPSIGRLAQETAPKDGNREIAAALGAMCTAKGLAYDATAAAVEAAGFSLRTDSETPLPPHTGDDCDYCAIAAASLVPVPTSAIALAPVVAVASPARGVPAPIWHYPLGLGSRGPPLTV